MSDISKLQIYRCEHCGNIVEVLNAGGGQLACCGDPMTLISENTTDAAVEKHVPVLAKSGGALSVKVGSVAHPMADEHYIEWVQVIAGGRSYREFLSPGDAPEAVFQIDSDEYTVRAYCNLHGLWRA
ncbi:MAG: desulfoferrodoxin [Deltaproteobacteria bacterium]|nr:desulfoferrodoxin [Deltaproteobacteria bacterium]